MNLFNKQLFQLLMQIEQEMQACSLWQSLPPSPQAFLSEQPFAVDTMTPNEWLQWIFLPRIRALLDGNKPIPNFALAPYFEEALKEQNANKLLLLIKQLDDLVKGRV